MAPFTAWHHLLHGTIYCMAPFTAWHHLLHGTIYCIAPFAAWHHLLHGTIYCMAPFTAWHHLLHGTICDLGNRTKTGYDFFNLPSLIGLIDCKRIYVALKKCC
jgi:hypothetical protein